MSVCEKEFRIQNHHPKKYEAPQKGIGMGIENVVAWKGRKYTVLNPLIRLLDRLAKLICTFQNTKAGSPREGVGISSKSVIVVDKARKTLVVARIKENFQNRRGEASPRAYLLHSFKCSVN